MTILVGNGTGFIKLLFRIRLGIKIRFGMVGILNNSLLTKTSPIPETILVRN